MPSFTINVDGTNYTVGYDGTFNSPQGLLPALNNLGFGIFWIEVIGGNNVLTTVDNDNVFGNAETNPDPTTTSTTTTTTTAAPTPTTTSTSTTTTTAAPTPTTSTTTTSTTAAPTTSTTTTTTTDVGQTTTTSTTTTTTAAPTCYNLVVNVSPVDRAASDDGFVYFDFVDCFSIPTTISYNTNKTNFDTGYCYDILSATSVYILVGGVQTPVTLSNIASPVTVCTPSTTTTTTTSSTTTTTTAIPAFTANIATTNAYDACNAPELSNIVFDGNGLDACDSTTAIMDATLAAYLSSGQTFFISDRVGGIFYSSQWTRVGTTTTCNRDTSCVVCEAPITSTTTTSSTTTTTTLQQVWYQLTNCSGGGTVYSTNYDIGYAAVDDRVYGTVSGTPSTLVVASVLFSDPLGTQIGIVNSGLTLCPPATSTTTTTTTQPPVTLDLTSECTGGTQTITINNFAGGDGVDYYANTTTYGDPASAAAGATELVVGGTKTYLTQVSGTRYIYVYSGTRNTVKQGGSSCITTTTSTTTTSTTAPPFTADIATTNAYDACNAPELTNIVFYGNGADACVSTTAVMDGTLAAYLSAGQTFYINDRVSGIFYSSEWTRVGSTTTCIRNTSCLVCPAATTSTSTTTTTAAPTTTSTTTTSTTPAPTTSTTTTTTTQAAVDASISSVCTGLTQTITVDNFSGGDGSTYYANNTTYADAVSAAAGPVSLVVGGTRSYTNQPNGTRYVYITSTIRTNVKQGGQTCTTSTTTTTTTAAPTTTSTTTTSTTPAPTTTTSTTTTQAPVDASISSVCTGLTQTITVDNFSGGDGSTYYANDTTYADAVSAAAGPVSLVVGGTRSYTNQPNGTRYVYITSTIRTNVKQGGQTCTTSTTTTTTTAAPTTTTSTTTTTTTALPYDTYIMTEYQCDGAGNCIATGLEQYGAFPVGFTPSLTRYYKPATPTGFAYIVGSIFQSGTPKIIMATTSAVSCPITLGC